MIPRGTRATDVERLRNAFEERARILDAALRNRERELAILSHVAARIHGEEDIQGILDIALQEIVDGLELGAAWVFLGDDKEQKLHLAASRGVSKTFIEDVQSHGVGDCLCPEVFWTGHQMHARNATECPRIATVIDGPHSLGAHACVPLHFDGTRRGVLNVAARPGRLFTEDELRFFETVGHQVCLAIERSGHLRAERRRNQEARAMVAINRAIGGSLDLAAVLRAVGDSAHHVLGVEQVYILLGSDPRQLTVGHVFGADQGVLKPGQVLDLQAMSWTLAIRALDERRVLHVDDRDADDRVNREEARRLTIAAVTVAALVAHDQLLGLLLLAHRTPHRWSEAEIETAEALAGQASLAIENARLYEDARKASDAERRRNEEARAMAEISKAIGGSLDVKAVLESVGRSAREIVGADRAQIYLGSQPRQLVVGHLSGPAHPELHEGQALDLVALGAECQRRSLEERRVTRIDDWYREETDLARRWGMGSALMLPLVARRRTLGLLVLTRSEPHGWTEEQVETAEALAAQASVAIENARLYEDARRAYQDLKDAQQRILQTEKMAVLGTFASGLAHEVRNPLNSIALQLSILERRLSRGLNDNAAGEVGDVVGVIREEITRLDSLVGDFLLFSRTNRIQYEPSSLDGLIDDVVRLLRPEAKAAGVTIKRQRLGGELPRLRMDAERMKQVVINLVRNSIEAMPGGGLVTVAGGLVDSRARVVVQDSGPGLPEGLDVFQLFVTTKDQGTGLGLSIAQQIVLEHGGEIVAESEPGKGATFTVTLPLEPAEDGRQEGREA